MLTVQKNQNKKKSKGSLLLLGAFLTGGLILASKKKSSSPWAYINPATGQISKYYTMQDVTKSATATALNYQPQFNPPEQIWLNAAYVATMLLDPLKEMLPGKIIINSWYRDPYINEQVGGVPNSIHMDGTALDLDYYENGVRNNNKLVAAIRDILKFKWNELILEKGPETNPDTVHIALEELNNIGEIFYKNSLNSFLAKSKDWLNFNFTV